MHIHSYHINQHDREEHAKRLGLKLKQFDRLLASANYAYKVLSDLGPFYGKEEIKDPTFRITAEPVYLSAEIKNKLEKFGNNLLFLGKALKKLPQVQKEKLGNDIDFRIPLTWRVDTILTEAGVIKVNEIEGVDSANALMMAEQLAYRLQTLSKSTAAKLIAVIKAVCGNATAEKPLKIALLRSGTHTNPHTSNHRRFMSFIHELSKESIAITLFDEEELQLKIVTPDWSDYDGVINETGLSLTELQNLGIQTDQVISMGNYNALGNKGVFALLFDQSLKSFWIEQLGEQRLEELQELLIPSYFITTVQEIEQAHKEGKVVKVSWADSNTTLINRSRGVLMPEGDLEQNSEEREQVLKELLTQGVTIIAQEYVQPGRIHSYLRKKGKSLELVDWYNRICVKYVAGGNPNSESLPNAVITAVGVTLGPDVVPAGRKCAFTAGAFAE